MMPRDWSRLESIEPELVLDMDDHNAAWDRICGDQAQT